MITNPKHSRYMGKKYYTYEGKKKTLGGLSKMFNDLVLVEDEWVETVRGHSSAMRIPTFPRIREESGARSNVN